MRYSLQILSVAIILLLLFTIRFPALGQATTVVRQVQASSHCGPLPLPTGNVINVTPAQDRQLDDIIKTASSGDTILLADGLYQLAGDFL